MVIQAIKDATIRIPKFNIEDPKELPYDFMALREDPRTGVGNKVVVLIGKKPGVPDDWAHAVNFGATAIWYRYHMYPVLG